MKVNRRTLLMLLVMFLGLAFVYLGFTFSLLGFLATIGAWILIILVYYDYRQAQKKWEREHTKH